jgi:cold shock CspA family protein
MENKYKGRVVWFNKRRGYGFIKNEFREEIFFHHSDLITHRKPAIAFTGDNVEYEMNEDEQKAEKVKIVPKKTKAGRKLILAFIAKFDEDKSVPADVFDYIAKARSHQGLKHFSFLKSGEVLVTDSRVTRLNAERIAKFLKEENEDFIGTDMEFDIKRMEVF